MTMKKLTITKSSRRTLTSLSVVAAALLFLPVFMFTMRKHTSDSIIVPSHLVGNSRSPVEEVSGGNSGMEKICFVRGAWIYVLNLATGKETKLVEGENPQLAPRGQSIVFISVKENEGVRNRVFPPAGRLRLLDVETREIRDFSELRDVHVGDTIWSDDGSRIAFTPAIAYSDQPYIGVLNPVTGQLEKSISTGWDQIPNNNGIYLDAWAPDNQSILFHTVGALYQAQVDNSNVQRIPVKELFESGEDFSGTRFSYSSDGRYLLFNQTINTPEEPQSDIISIFNLTTKTLRRVTPKFVIGRDPIWLPSNREILFGEVKWVDGKNGHLQFNISKIGIDGTGLTTLVTNGGSPSYSK